MVVPDPVFATIVRQRLELSHYTPVFFSSTQNLIRALRREAHDLVVLDIDAHATSWRSFLEWGRNWLNQSPLILLIGTDVNLTEAALDAGADEFVGKRVLTSEFSARVRALSRRKNHAFEVKKSALAGCVLDRASSSLSAPGKRIELTARELAIAQLMFERAGEIVSRNRLAREIWGGDEDLVGRSIDQHIYQLRRKLKQCAGDRLNLRTVYGSGYRLDVLHAESPDEVALQGTDSSGFQMDVVTREELAALRIPY